MESNKETLPAMALGQVWPAWVRYHQNIPAFNDQPPFSRIEACNGREIKMVDFASDHLFTPEEVVNLLKEILQVKE